MTTLDQQEVDKFSKIADQWWDQNGKFKPLHKFNPCRISYIREKICQAKDLDQTSKQPFKELKIIDIGCGGGLISEPMANLGADVTAIDASEKNIKVAQIHSEKSGLKINYQQSLVEDFAAKKTNQGKYDVVLALEIIEHVADVEKFIENLAKLVKKDGIVFIATLNRTIKSLLTAKIGAEYILRWMEPGTHDWKKFLKPSEITEFAENHNLQLRELCGFEYCIFKDQWSQNSNNLDVNYIAVFNK